MATTFSNAFVRGYNNSVYKNIEFQGNMFRGKCREEAQIGELEFYETLGSIYAQNASDTPGEFGSYNTTPIMYPAHAKRVCAQVQADIGTTINKLEEVQALVTFESPYVVRMAEALNRQRDIQTIRGALSTASTGKLADGTADFDYANQTIAAGATGMSVDKLIAIREKFLANGYMETDEFFVALSGKQIGDLLKDPNFTNYDFNDRKPLVDGVVYRYLGINVVQSELIPYDDGSGEADLTWGATDLPAATSTTRGCFAWVKRALLVGTNPTIKTEVGKDPYHKFNWVAYACQGIGAVRMEETGILYVPCVEA